MRYPSIKTLVTRLGITAEQAEALRYAMRAGKALSRYNRMCDGFGLDSISLPDGCLNNCQDPDVTCHYVNRGDTYATTLMKVNGQYRVG